VSEIVRYFDAFGQVAIIDGLPKRQFKRQHSGPDWEGQDTQRFSLLRGIVHQRGRSEDHHRTVVDGVVDQGNRNADFASAGNRAEHPAGRGAMEVDPIAVALPSSPAASQWCAAWEDRNSLFHYDLADGLLQYRLRARGGVRGAWFVTALDVRLVGTNIARSDIAVAGHGEELSGRD
jgi:hypothetical protein